MEWTPPAYAASSCQAETALLKAKARRSPFHHYKGAERRFSVLPFNNLSSDPEQDYFADGIVEDIITALSRFSELFVIARNSSFSRLKRSMSVWSARTRRAVCAGGQRQKVRRSVATRVAADPRGTGTHHWAKTTTAHSRMCSSWQDEVVSRSPRCSRRNVRKAESERALAKPSARQGARSTHVAETGEFSRAKSAKIVAKIGSVARGEPSPPLND